MIILKKYKEYLKNIILFSSLELFLVIIISSLNMFGMSSSISSIILLIINVCIFLFFGYIHGNTQKYRGFITGFVTGLIFTLFMYIINILFFKGNFNINLFMYYLILILSATLGGMIGKIKKTDD